MINDPTDAGAPSYALDYLAGGACCLLPPPTKRIELSPAEQQVFDCLLQGLSDKEIAAARGVAYSTVKHQVVSCLRKYGVPSRARLLAVAR